MQDISFGILGMGFQLLLWQVHRKYYPAVREALLRVTGGTRAHIFDHTLRFGDKFPT